MDRARRILSLLATGVLAAWVPFAGAEDAPRPWLTAVEAEAAPTVTTVAPAREGEWEKPGILKAFRFGVDYTLATDYVWRGVNFSEYAGEGREKLNHQLGVSFEFDPSKIGGANIGRFGGSFWFEWFGGQEALTGWSDNNLQEVDYTVYWAHECPALGLGVEIGWIAYHYPRFRDSGSDTSADFAYTHEVYFGLSYDDSRLFGQPMLSPTLTYYQDVDDVRGGALSLGVSHDFELSKFCPDVPWLTHVTVTPSLALWWDHRFYDKAGLGSNSADPAVGSRLGFLEYGLAVAYDLSGALNIPPQYGALTLTGFLNFVQSFHDESAAVQDEFYGGFTLGWGW
ncbi:MAG TPA: hypothetical protein VM695_12050 [Phycisphaerae bacterium]|nr:hypothetical protein [Phycisphaerae bacterium]